MEGMGFFIAAGAIFLILLFAAIPPAMILAGAWLLAPRTGWDPFQIWFWTQIIWGSFVLIFYLAAAGHITAAIKYGRKLRSQYEGRSDND